LKIVAGKNKGKVDELEMVLSYLQDSNDIKDIKS